MRCFAANFEQAVWLHPCKAVFIVQSSLYFTLIASFVLSKVCIYQLRFAMLSAHLHICIAFQILKSYFTHTCKIFVLLFFKQMMKIIPARSKCCLIWSLFAFVTRRPYCPWRPKMLCFTTQSLASTVLTARLCVVKQSFFGLPGQYGRHVTKANIFSYKKSIIKSIIKSVILPSKHEEWNSM